MLSLCKFISPTPIFKHFRPGKRQKIAFSLLNRQFLYTKKMLCYLFHWIFWVIKTPFFVFLQMFEIADLNPNYFFKKNLQRCIGSTVFINSYLFTPLKFFHCSNHETQWINQAMVELFIAVVFSGYHSSKMANFCYFQSLWILTKLWRFMRRILNKGNFGFQSYC